MTDQPVPPSVPEPDRTALAQADLDSCRQLMMGLVRSETAWAHRFETKAEAAKDCAPELVAPFERLATGARRCVMLVHKLAQPLPERAVQRAPTRLGARKRIIRGVGDRIALFAPDEPAAQRMWAELLERLDSPDLDDDITERPADEVMTDLCHDIGVLTPPKLTRYCPRSPEAADELCALAAMPAGARGCTTPPRDPGPRLPIPTPAPSRTRPPADPFLAAPFLAALKRDPFRLPEL